MISGYFGLPGSGKTSFLTMIAQRELKRIKKGKSKYKKVFTNFECSGCYQLSFNYLGNYHITDALILIDEITLEADSRDFKEFNKKLKYFFIMHRHYHCDVIYFCQQYDGLDKKIRDLTAELWYVKRVAVFSVATRIYRILDIDDHTHDIVQGYRFPTVFENIFSLLLPFAFSIRRFCFRPLYYKYFDSWIAEELTPFKPEKWPQLAAAGCGRRSIPFVKGKKKKRK